MKGGMGLSPIEGVDWPWHFILIQPVTTELFSKFLRRGVFLCRFCTKTSSFFSFLGDTVCFLYIQKRPSQNHSSLWNPGGKHLQLGLHNLGKNTGGSKSVGSSTLSGVGFDWGILWEEPTTVNFEFWTNQAKKKSQKHINCPQKDTRHVFFRKKKIVGQCRSQLVTDVVHGTPWVEDFWNIQLDMFFVIWIFNPAILWCFLLVSFLPWNYIIWLYVFVSTFEDYPTVILIS